MTKVHGERSYLAKEFYVAGDEHELYLWFPLLLIFWLLYFGVLVFSDDGNVLSPYCTLKTGAEDSRKFTYVHIFIYVHILSVCL